MEDLLRLPVITREYCWWSLRIAGANLFFGHFFGAKMSLFQGLPRRIAWSCLDCQRWKWWSLWHTPGSSWGHIPINMIYLFVKTSRMFIFLAAILIPVGKQKPQHRGCLFEQVRTAQLHIWSSLLAFSPSTLETLNTQHLRNGLPVSERVAALTFTHEVIQKHC